MCAVRRVELLQDVADVHLDRVFLHVQPGGDQLIGLALAQKIDYRKLTRREVQSVRSPLPFTFRLVIKLCGWRRHPTLRNKGAIRGVKKCHYRRGRVGSGTEARRRVKAAWALRPNVAQGRA